MSNWIDVGAVDDVPVLGSRIVKSPAGCIAIFRDQDDAVFALENKCPHKGGPLSEGIVHDRKVTCPLHNAIISLESGEVTNEDYADVPIFEIKVEAGRMLLDVSALKIGKAS